MFNPFIYSLFRMYLLGRKKDLSFTGISLGFALAASINYRIIVENIILET